MAVPLSAANIRLAQQQLGDELTVMRELLDESAAIQVVRAPSEELRAVEDAYHSTKELHRELTPLLERIEEPEWPCSSKAFPL